MIGGGRREILDKTDRVGAKSPIFDLFARSDSVVTPSEKSSINTNRNYYALSNEPKMNIVRCS